MTVSREIEAEIRVLHFGEHLPVGTVASQLHIHEDVVRRVTGLLLPRTPSVVRAHKVDPVKPFIIETLHRFPRLRATRLYDMVQPRGYEGSVRTLRDFVREVRPKAPSEVFLRLTPLIGEQAQIDWAHVGDVEVAGGHRTLWLFVMSLPWSRAMWGEFVLDLTAWSLARSLSRGCEYFGGSAREWLFDNPKIVVLERHGDAARFHPLLLEQAGHYAVRLKLCAVRKANQKGGVERMIRYIRERFLAARTIRSVEQGNREFLAFLDDIAHARAHPTLPGRTVRDCFEQERSRLLPLPRSPFTTDQILPVRVDKTAFCRFDTNSYSVEPQYAGTTLTLVADDRQIRVLDGDTVAACHARCWGRRQPVEAPEHREAILALKRGARPGKGRDRLSAAVPAIDSLYLRWIDAGRNLGSMTARTLKLLELYGAQVLAAAVQQVLDRGLHDPGALASLCEQHRRAQSAPVPTDVALPPHVRDRDVIPHPLESYDAKPPRRG
jgi:transposase